MPSSKITQRTVALVASILVSFAVVESIADYAIVDDRSMVLVQASPAPAPATAAAPAATPAR
jgi:hypothetical protein